VGLGGIPWTLFHIYIWETVTGQRLNMTKHRQLVLDFVRAYVRLHGVPPSYEVIAKGIGLSSKSNVHRIIHRLKEDGHLTVRPYKFHSIRLVDKSVKEMAAL
jgi:SOS-response transcriptional repressor LexA